jgi:hypothetical protein
MIISYKKKSINFNLVYALFHMVLAFIMMYLEGHLWISYFWMAFSVLCIINYYFQKTYQYLSIENGIIKINEPFGKKLKLSEIQKIKKIAGDYILKTDHKELTINTQFIEPKSLILLNSELEKLNAVWY